MTTQKIDFSELEKKFNISFNNKDLLMQAFCHRSYLNEHPEFKLDHNERLEFLGDAVIELVVSEHLFENYRMNLALETSCYYLKGNKKMQKEKRSHIMKF